MFFQRKKNKKEEDKRQLDKTTAQIFEIELERQMRKRLSKSTFTGLTGSELLAAAITGDEELLLTGGRKRLTEFKNDKSFAEKYEAVVWVYICVNANARNIAGVPILIVDEKGDEIEDHEFYETLKQPNPDLTLSDLLEKH